MRLRINRDGHGYFIERKALFGWTCYVRVAAYHDYAPDTPFYFATLKDAERYMVNTLEAMPVYEA